MSDRKDRDFRPEPRPACKLGALAFGFGRDSAQTILAPCTCNTWLTCGHCGEPHVWLYLCDPCASRRPEAAA